MRYEPRREYPYGRLAAQVLGFVGGDQAGLAGVEQQFDEVLRGIDGQRSATVDVHRRRLHAEEETYEPPRDGSSVVVTIDAHVSSAPRFTCGRRSTNTGHNGRQPLSWTRHSGEILAMATLPDFEPAEPIAAGLSEQQRREAVERLRNRVISDSYEPGSIFKPFIAGPALESGLVQMNERFAVNGPTHRFGRRTIKDTHTYDALALHQIRQQVEQYWYGDGRGTLWERAAATSSSGVSGLATRPGFVCPGSTAAWCRTSRDGRITRRSPSRSGQEIGVTAMQIVTAFSAFCNGGVIYRPRIVRGVIGADGQTIEDDSRPVAVRRVLPEGLAREFRLCALVETVNDGTGDKAQIAGYQTFGKTGTAQVAYPDGGGYMPNEHAGSFVGGAPADDPRVAVLVTLYRPSGGKYYGRDRGRTGRCRDHLRHT